VAGDVPRFVTTLTPTVPSFVGAVAVIVVGESTAKLEDALVPKYTALVVPNPLPLMSTVAPPPAETASGDSDVTTGPPGSWAVATVGSTTPTAGDVPTFG
jgi:hypothetical protein